MGPTRQGRSKNLEGPHSETFPYVKQQYFFSCFFEVTDHKIRTFKIRKAQYNAQGIINPLIFRSIFNPIFKSKTN
jgi:hypothetical protein